MMPDMTKLRAHFDGKVLIPVEPVDLPTDRELEIEVNDVTEPLRGSAAALLKAMRSPPHLEPGDAEALERAIEEGKLPVRYDGIFDDER
jgi:hypothetical protein